MHAICPVRRMLRALFCGAVLTATLPAARAQQSPIGSPQPLVPASGWRTAPSCTAPPPCAVPAPSTTPPTVPPTVPPPDPTTPPSVNVADAGAGARGGEETALSAPNMYGDAFGGAATRSVLTLIRPSFLNNQTLLGSFQNFDFTGPSPHTTYQNFGTQPLFISVGSFSIPPIQTLAIPGVNHFVFNTQIPNANGTAVINPTQSFAQANGIVQQIAPSLLTRFVQQNAPAGSTALPVTLVNPQALIVPDPSRLLEPFNANFSYMIQSQLNTPLVVTIPSPSAGGVVGRTKIADDNSPLPRDRIIFNYDYFNYDYFDNAQLTSQGVGVHRFSPGFEKTFFDQMASIEVRVPFASTVSNDISGDGVNSGGHIELGDVNVTLKGLLYRSDAVNVALGLGMALPTADDVNVSVLGGTPLVKIHNDAVILTPFVALLLTPNDRFFVQSWFQIGFDPNGNAVDANPDLTSGLQRFGQLRDQNLMQIDAQLGYWLYRSEDRSARLRGLAPFVELHYNSTMGKGDSVQAGAFTIGDPNSSLDELNLTAGLTAQLGDNLSVSLGVVAPLRDQPERTFDWQVGLRASWYFGASSGQRSAASRVSNF
jgi:hypothetical protein